MDVFNEFLKHFVVILKYMYSHYDNTIVCYDSVVNEVEI